MSPPHIIDVMSNTLPMPVYRLLRLPRCAIRRSVRNGQTSGQSRVRPKRYTRRPQALLEVLGELLYQRRVGGDDHVLLVALCC